MIATETQLLRYLDEQRIPYQYIAHPAVFTCEEAERYRPAMGGVSTKNLFLRDRQGQFYLLMTDCAKQMDLKALGTALGVSKLHFAAEKELMVYLGVGRGAVTVLGLINDLQGKVRLLVDADIWEGDFFLCHPLVNTASLLLAKADLERFLALSQHPVELIPVPAR